MSLLIFSVFLNLFFLADRALFSLRMSPTNFREARPNRYRDMVKCVGNMIILIFVAFLNRFL